MSKQIKRISTIQLKEQPEDWDGDDFEPGWYIKDTNNLDFLYCGPYATKRELDESGDKEGLKDFWRQHAG